MKFNVITLFPESFDALNHSIIKRAQEKNLIKISLINLRDFGIGKHKQVDDTPYGGGVGMILKVDVMAKAINHTRRYAISDKHRIILLTPQGKRYTQADAKRLSKYNNLTLICGHYEGFDERVRDLVDEEISIGDYVLTGGELPAMVLIDSITRLLPGVLGKDHSSLDESHSKVGKLEYPQYTRPEKYTLRQAQGAKKIAKVPDILLSGNHAEIKNWREEQSQKRSRK
jgi:tRNA (guanine37-N1)-methyltransferase